MTQIFASFLASQGHGRGWHLWARESFLRAWTSGHYPTRWVRGQFPLATGCVGFPTTSSSPHARLFVTFLALWHFQYFVSYLLLLTFGAQISSEYTFITVWSSWFYSIPTHCNQIEAGRNNSLVSACAMNVSINYCYWKQGTWPRWWQHDKCLYTLYMYMYVFSKRNYCICTWHFIKHLWPF